LPGVLGRAARRSIFAALKMKDVIFQGFHGKSPTEWNGPKWSCTSSRDENVESEPDIEESRLDAGKLLDEQAVAFEDPNAVTGPPERTGPVPRTRNKLAAEAAEIAEGAGHST